MKKLLSLVLALMLIVMVFGACSTSNTPNDATEEPSSSAGPAESPDSKEGEEEAGTPAKIGSPEEPVVVKIIEKDVSPDEEDVQGMVKVIEEKMAEMGNYVKIEYLEAPAGKYIEVLPLALRTGQIEPDIVYVQNGIEFALVNEGMFVDLTDYINNSEFAKDVMEEYNWERLKQYPYLMWMAPPLTYCGLIRSDWFNQLDSADALMADPTPENYYNMFKELKDKGICEYPLTTDNNKLRLDGVFNQAFGITSTIMQADDGSYHFMHVSEGTRDKLEYLHKLYKEGLFDPEFITNTWDVMEQRYYDGIAAVISARVGDVAQIHEDKMVQVNGESASLTALPPAKGIAHAYAAVDLTREPRGFAIMEDSEVKDAAFAVLDFICSPEGRMLDKLGLEGVHYKIENDSIFFTEERPSWWSRFFETTNGFKPTQKMEQPLYSPPVQDTLDLAIQYYAPDVNIIIPPDLATNWDAMINLYDEFYADVIRGERPISDFDAFVEQWNAAGGNVFAEYLAEELD